MIQPRLRLPRRALACLAVACLALPATAFVLRLTVYFHASFDVSGSPGGGGLPAEVGEFGVVAQPSEFSVVPGGNGGGELKINDSGTAAEAILDAKFNKLFKGTELDLEWSVQPAQTDATFIVSAQDAGDTGLIDLTMDDDGTVDVDGMDTGYAYSQGETYDMRLKLMAPLLGTGSWTLQISVNGAVVFQKSGVFNPPAGFSVRSLRFIRPANEPAAEFRVDDIRASSQSFGAKFSDG